MADSRLLLFDEPLPVNPNIAAHRGNIPQDRRERDKPFYSSSMI